MHGNVECCIGIDRLGGICTSRFVSLTQKSPAADAAHVTSTGCPMLFT